MAMKCARCGAAVAPAAKSCPGCGTAMPGSAAADFLELDEPPKPLRPAAPVTLEAPSPARRPPPNLDSLAPPSTGRRGAMLRPPEEPAKGWWKWLRHPAASMAVGLVAFPVAKALFLPGYIFNFLTTLVHEIGHCAFAWLMGMPSIPGVSILGGGMTVWQDQKLPICLAWLAAIGWLGWRFRENKISVAAAVAGGVLYATLAFTSAREFLPVAGGVLFEIGGAAVCFFVATAPVLRREFERPLYALWAWWMLLNRGTETVLMLKDRSYWNASTVYESGLAAGLTNDLEVIREKLGTGPEPMLRVVFVLCLLCLPAALAARWAVGKWGSSESGDGRSA
ncbi:MAG: zinc ribbon domain-containing protein [Planctomycetes bacterium]|nr:zinc ribbon domain-containing protein [Planctomycetota bacterium]